MDTYRYPMIPRNPFLRAKEFASITTDPTAMRVFLSVASSTGPKTFDALAKETGIDVEGMNEIIGKLELGGFIRRNPSPASTKFVLALNGQLFAEQLRITFPAVRELIGDRTLIEELSE